VWPFPLKNSRKSLRIWEVVNVTDAFMGAGFMRAGRSMALSPNGRVSLLDRRNHKGYQARAAQSSGS
jgi:hypothetical protein